MVTAEIFDKLRELQNILARKNQLDSEILEAPQLLVKQEELLARYKTNYIKKNADDEAIRQTIGALKAELFETEQKREHAEKGMDGITTQREYDALDREIQDATKKEAELRKEILKNEANHKRLDEEIKNEEALIKQQEQDIEERKAMMLPGVLHNIRLASAPTATTDFVPRSTATTEGSLTTIPFPFI